MRKRLLLAKALTCRAQRHRYNLASLTLLKAVEKLYITTFDIGVDG